MNIDRRKTWIRNAERRKTWVRVLAMGALSLAIVLAMVSPGVAQPVLGDVVGETITMDVKDRPLKDVVQYIRERTEVNIIVAPEAEPEKVTISVMNLHWRKVLELVAEKAECILVPDGPNLIKVERPPQVSFEFQDADIRKVISVIAAYSGANIVVGQEVQGTITVRLNRVPWRNALEVVVKTLGFVVVEDDWGVLRITDPATLQEQLETRVHTFRYIRPPAPYLATISTDVHVDSVRAPGQDLEKEFNLLVAMRAAVLPEGSVEYIRASNSIVVTGTVPKLQKLEELIQQVDVEPVMVAVDLHFITTRNRDFLDVGVDPGDQGWKISMDLGKMTHRLPFNLGEHGWEDSISAEGRPEASGLDWRGTGPSPISNGFTFGTLDFTGIQSSLRLLKQDISTRIVQAPKILTLDNQAATIFVGETVRYARTVAESSQQGGLQFSIDEAESSPVQVGFQLLVVPHVIPGTDKVMMTIIPQQKALVGTSAEQPGFNIFRSGSGATEVQIALPQEASSTVVTHMLLESGEAAVIGGLLTDTEGQTVNKIPLLGDLPFIGWLFKNEQTSKTKEHLIILVVPHILRGAAERRAALSDELRDYMRQREQEYSKIVGDEVKKLDPLQSKENGEE